VAATAAAGIAEAINSRFGYGEVVCSEPSRIVYDASGSAELPDVPVANGRFVDPQDGRVWRMDGQDWELTGQLTGVFQGWVDDNSLPGADAQPGLCWGRFANEGGFGIVAFSPAGNPKK